MTSGGAGNESTQGVAGAHYYGTIAKMRLSPGAEPLFRAQFAALVHEQLPGWVYTTFYQSDFDPLDVWMVTAFESREAYRANAERPNMDALYRRIRGCLSQDPEWHDGPLMAAYGLGAPRS